MRLRAGQSSRFWILGTSLCYAMDDECAAALAAALATHWPSLTELDLRWNEFSAAGKAALAAANRALKITF